ncbi:MAG: ribbon-helix-helix protein, CopG family [Chromatiales bacterium]|nr:ribbon-helix-helix protein, CopG family [Chromatiales bacterium]MCK7581162.1 ribbon-helix-helix protein, CopG family [Chromatiales bacterium]
MLKDHDIHLWLDADDYAWITRQAREQERSKSAVIRRLIKQARAESMEDDEEFTRADLGRVRPISACKGCAK